MTAHVTTPETPSRVRYTAFIRNNKTGEVRQYAADVDVDYRDIQMFSWGENNFKCDCNRHVCFELAANPEWEDDDEFPCGETAYAVLKLAYEDGAVEYPDGVSP